MCELLGEEFDVRVLNPSGVEIYLPFWVFKRLGRKTGDADRFCRGAACEDSSRARYQQKPGRGRNADRSAPPAQIRTGATNAYGSYLG